jgi:hypothetical protein
MALLVLLILSIRDVAQPGRAHGWGPWSRWFESSHPDHFRAGVQSLVPLQISFEFAKSKNRLSWDFT